jgi:hypothetical protein
MASGASPSDQAAGLGNQSDLRGSSARNENGEAMSDSSSLNPLSGGQGGASPLEGLPGPLKQILGGPAAGAQGQAGLWQYTGSKAVSEAGTAVAKSTENLSETEGKQLSQTIAQSTASLVKSIDAATVNSADVGQSTLDATSSYFQVVDWIFGARARCRRGAIFFAPSKRHAPGTRMSGRRVNACLRKTLHMTPSNGLPRTMPSERKKRYTRSWDVLR